MAKHIHKFYKVQTEAKSRYMWKCADCAWFVHAGLEHVMPGKSARCWKCNDVFQVSEFSMDQDKMTCLSCSGVLDVLDAIEQRQNQIPENETDEEREKREWETRRKVWVDFLNK